MKVNGTKYRRRAQKSLQTVLLMWFLVFSILPIAFITGYSIVKYEKAINNELTIRLVGNGREIETFLKGVYQNISNRQKVYVKDLGLAYALLNEDKSLITKSFSSWMQKELTSSVAFFNRDGRMIFSKYKKSSGQFSDYTPFEASPIYLSESNLKRVQSQGQLIFIEQSRDKVSIVAHGAVRNSSQRITGYVEKIFEIDASVLKTLKNRFKLEILLLGQNNEAVVSSFDDSHLGADYFQGVFQDPQTYYDLVIQGQSFGFVKYPIRLGSDQINMAIGASKQEATEVLKNVNVAFFFVVGLIVLLLIVAIFFVSKNILKPIRDLVDAIDKLQLADQPIELPVKSDTEIGLLTESFNEMVRKVSRVQGDLNSKIVELEKANLEIKEAQQKLVHSSKMISLGQLVAGVAHELNNPIGFIYSNMNHLREYSQKLMKLADTAEQDPLQISKMKQEIDLEYIKKDMPKLIGSCEDGARRVRDIVLGLRNFSRLDESQIKQVDFNQVFDSTLDLLSGEIKNRIQIIKSFEKLPLVNCYATQVSQVIMNILTNAVQAIDGTGNIWLTTKKTTYQGVPSILLSIQDSGMGMPPEVQEKIFDPFFSTKGVGQGTGLGLSISYGIIENHGGHIEVKSQVGIGTEFIIYIPIEPKIGR